MQLFAIRNGAKNYNDPIDQALIAKHGAALIGMYPTWYRAYGASRVLAIYRALNPTIKVFNYIDISEQLDDDSEPAKWCRAHGWYAKKADGTLLQWTGLFDTPGAKRIDTNPCTRAFDDHGLNHQQRFVDLWLRGWHPGFDGHMVDNFTANPMSPSGDWLGQGRDVANTDPATAAAFRVGMMRGVERIKANEPSALVMVNSDDAGSPEYRGQFDGILRESLVGRNWSLEKRLGWDVMMASYRAALANVKPGGMVVFNVADTDSTDANAPCVGEDRKRHLRYCLTSCLLDDGYFSWSPTASVVAAQLEWFPEFDIDLGPALDKTPLAPYEAGAYCREYAKGFVFCNPTKAPAAIRVPSGRNLYDPLAKPIKWAAYWTVPPRDGLVLLK